MRRCVVLATMLAATACVAAPARRAPAPATPTPTPTFAAPETDPANVRDDCLACHTGDLIRQQRLTEKQWTKTVDKMRTWGAPTEDDGVQPLLTHLAAVGARDAGPFHPQILSAGEAASLFARQPDGAFAGGDAKHGAAMFADQCAPCHAGDATGGTMGVALVGRHLLDRASDFAAIVRAGRGRMPAYERATDADIADYLAYVRALSPP